MKYFRKVVAVTLVTAIVVISCCVSSYATVVNSDYSYSFYSSQRLFVPSPKYPTSESLPYGNDTLIYEIPKNNGDGSHTFHRFYIKKDVYSGTDFSVFNGITAIMSREKKASYTLSSLDLVGYAFTFKFISKSTIYYEKFTVKDNDQSSFDFSDLVTVDYGNTVNGVVYPTITLSGYLYFVSGVQSASGFLESYYCNAPAYCGGKPVSQISNYNNFPEWQRFDYINTDCFVYDNPANFRYPSSTDISKFQTDLINGKLDTINDNITGGVDEILGGIDSASDEIVSGINSAVDEIISGANDVPTLDTDNGWMNDSLTKINGWLEDLKVFEEQMKENEIENAENMEQAKNFLSRFFDILPAPIVVAFIMFLVVIVAVKVVGR